MSTIGSSVCVGWAEFLGNSTSIIIFLLTIMPTTSATEDIASAAASYASNNTYLRRRQLLRFKWPRRPKIHSDVLLFWADRMPCPHCGRNTSLAIGYAFVSRPSHATVDVLQELSEGFPPSATSKECFACCDPAPPPVTWPQPQFLHISPTRLNQSDPGASTPHK